MRRKMPAPRHLPMSNRNAHNLLLVLHTMCASLIHARLRPDLCIYWAALPRLTEVRRAGRPTGGCLFGGHTGDVGPREPGHPILVPWGNRGIQPSFVDRRRSHVGANQRPTIDAAEPGVRKGSARHPPDGPRRAGHGRSRGCIAPAISGMGNKCRTFGRSADASAKFPATPPHAR